SRKAQYGLFIGYVIALAGMVVAVLLLAIAIIDPRGFNAIKGAALDVTTPISSGGRGVVRFFGGIGGTVSDYFQAGSQNSRLRAQLQATQRELLKAKSAESENVRLLQLLRLGGEVEDEITIARIVSSSFQSPRRFATLAAGSAAGVGVGLPVRSADGLIGRIIETGRWASRVLLVTDGRSQVPVRMVRDGTPALAAGRGDGTLELRTLEVGENPFRHGDILVTSGIGGIFPPNIPVATVIRIEGDSAIANPVADPARLDFAIVQRAYMPAANADLEVAAPQAIAPPVTSVPTDLASPPSALTPTPRQNDPNYQPALQQPQPVQAPPARAPATAPPQPQGTNR
ncbi:MAG: rod shape-determining protein MreC, partial [Allosphingosinicella sp.]